MLATLEVGSKLPPTMEGCPLWERACSRLFGSAEPFGGEGREREAGFAAVEEFADQLPGAGSEASSANTAPASTAASWCASPSSTMLLAMVASPPGEPPTAP